MRSAGLVQVTRRVFPTAEIAAVHRIGCAQHSLDALTYDLVLPGTVFADGDVFELLAWCERTHHDTRHFMVVLEEPMRALVEKLRATGIAGAFDACGEDGASR